MSHSIDNKSIASTEPREPYIHKFSTDIQDSLPLPGSKYKKLMGTDLLN